MTKIEMYVILADVVGEDNLILSYFLKSKIKKQVLTDIETSITRLLKRRGFFHISGDYRRAKQVEEALDVLFKFRDEVKNEKL